MVSGMSNKSLWVFLLEQLPMIAVGLGAYFLAEEFGAKVVLSAGLLIWGIVNDK